MPLAHERRAERKRLTTGEPRMLRQVPAEGPAVLELLRHERPQAQATFVVPDERIRTPNPCAALTDALVQVPVLHGVEVFVVAADGLEDAAPEEAGRLDRVVAQVAAALERLATRPESVAEALLRNDDGVHAPCHDLAAR